MVPLEIWSLQPGRDLSPRLSKRSGSAYRPLSLSNLSLMHLENFLKSRFDLELSVSTVMFWRCHNRSHPGASV